jgi:hypothetical protein
MLWKLSISSLQNVSKAAIRSTQIMPHVDYRNLTIKSSDPGALSGGRDLITARTSAFVKHYPSSANSSFGRSSTSKLMACYQNAGMPRISLKKSKAHAALSASSSKTRHL